MTDKVLVPQGMLKAGITAIQRFGPTEKTGEECFAIGLEAAIIWLHEQDLTDNMIHEFYSGECEAGVSFDFLRKFWKSMLRRMIFFAPEPEVPEQVKDLLCADIESGFFKPEILNERIIEAYRRGQKATGARPEPEDKLPVFDPLRTDICGDQANHNIRLAFNLGKKAAGK